MAVFKNESGGLVKSVRVTPTPTPLLPSPFRLTVICVFKNASGGFVDTGRGVKISLGMEVTLSE